jgi:DDE superfamily endonuclease
MRRPFGIKRQASLKPLSRTQLSSLTPEQRLRSFVVYLKHDNSVSFESALWNWSRTSANDDAHFVASCVNVAASDEIRWPATAERLHLATQISELPGCIGFIDGTLVQIRRPHGNPMHANWFNGRKKMYCLNNTVVVDHNGLFIYVDTRYPGKFHDANILRHSNLYREWRDYFTHNDDYFEYVFGIQDTLARKCL